MAGKFLSVLIHEARPHLQLRKAQDAAQAQLCCRRLLKIQGGAADFLLMPVLGSILGSPKPGRLGVRHISGLRANCSGMGSDWDLLRVISIMEGRSATVAIQELGLTVADCVDGVVWEVAAIRVQHDHVHRCRTMSIDQNRRMRVKLMLSALQRSQSITSSRERKVGVHWAAEQSSPDAL